MAMTILNNASTAMTLGELNKNINKVGKALSKVSSGQKIVGASDNAADFAISEKMREQIRSLEQDIQNVQNGSALFKTAHGGIENIVEELRSLKELAINAANDSNTDADREIIQKEFDQRRATIDEIAQWTTYNTKPLLDGTWENKLKVHSTGGGSGAGGDIGVLRSFSLGSPNSSYSNNYQSYYPIYNQNSNGTTTRSYLVGHLSFKGNYSNSWSGNPLPNLRWGDGTYVGYSSDIAVKMDFSKYTGNLTGRKMRNALNGEGFSIVCGGCDQFINIKFDSEKSLSESEKGTPTSEGDTPVYISSDSIEYTIGIRGIKNGKELTKAVFDAIKTINSEDGYNASSSGVEATMLGERHDVNLLKMGDSYFVTKNSSPDLIFYNGLLGNSNPSNGSRRVYYEAIRQNPLTIHHGTKANQATNFYINNMHTNALKGENFPSEADEARLQSMEPGSEEYERYLDLIAEASQKTLEDAKVTTQRDANVAVRIVDGAIEYALGEATNIGAYLQRLEYTQANVTTQNENTQGAESTIRDADMAKEMTEYTKQNVLSQAAQSMLAQANQNLSGVLGLLQ